MEYVACEVCREVFDAFEREGDDSFHCEECCAHYCSKECWEKAGGHYVKAKDWNDNLFDMPICGDCDPSYPKEVEFMTAYKALKDGKEAKCLNTEMYYTYGKYPEHSGLCLSNEQGQEPTQFKSFYFEPEEIESKWIVIHNN